MGKELLAKIEEQNREIAELKAKLDKQSIVMEVVGCLGKLHIAVYYIELLTGKYKEVSIITDIPRFSPNMGDFKTTTEGILEHTIGPEYREAMRIFLDLSTMRDRLRKQDVINIVFQNHSGKWRQATMIANHRDETGEVVNVLYLTTDIDSFKRREMEYQRALELSNKQKDDYLESLLQERQEKENYYFKSRLDLMTGLYHKTIFFEEAQEYLDNNPELNVGLLFLDIDDFKKINDRFGHQFGDIVIKRVADVLSTSLANKDIICRYGGDEFCALLKDISKEKLQDKVDFLHKKLKKEFAYSRAKDMISCSLGVVFRQGAEHSCSLDELIAQADADTYKCKHAGKDQYSLSVFEG